MILFLGWTAWRFQQRGAAPAALLAAVIASWAAAHGMAPFQQGTLFEKMITLQSFNATVAFSSLFFAALVTERTRAREALERAAAELEDRVARRTAELSAANERLNRRSPSATTRTEGFDNEKGNSPRSNRRRRSGIGSGSSRRTE